MSFTLSEFNEIQQDIISQANKLHSLAWDYSTIFSFIADGMLLSCSITSEDLSYNMVNLKDIIIKFLNMLKDVRTFINGEQDLCSLNAEFATNFKKCLTNNSQNFYLRLCFIDQCINAVSSSFPDHPMGQQLHILYEALVSLIEKLTNFHKLLYNEDIDRVKQSPFVDKESYKAFCNFLCRRDYFKEDGNGFLNFLSFLYQEMNKGHLEPNWCRRFGELLRKAESRSPQNCEYVIFGLAGVRRRAEIDIDKPDFRNGR